VPLLLSRHRPSSEIHPAAARELLVFKEFGCRLSILTPRGEAQYNEPSLPLSFVERPHCVQRNLSGKIPRMAKRRIYDDEKLEYMHMDPVHAGLVEKAPDWPWSSARQYLLGRSVGVPVKYLA
jgi:hypothetical protein